MDDKSKKSHTDDHDQLPSDEITRKKIDEHLSNIDDTISEQDIKNINTSTASTTIPDKKDADEDKEEETKREMPNTWDILDQS